MPLESASHDESYTQGSAGKPTLFARRVLPSHLVCKPRTRVSRESGSFCMMPALNMTARHNRQNQRVQAFAGNLPHHSVTWEY